MAPDDHDFEWLDPGGPEPKDVGKWLTPTGWSWDGDSLMLAEYVGFELYLKIRDRLTTTNVPTDVHNVLIQELIDTHDESLFDNGVACATLMHTQNAPGQLLMDMQVMDSTHMPPLTGVL